MLPSRVDINIPYISAVKGQSLHLNKEFTRQQFESLADPIFLKCIKLCELALKDAGLNTSEIDKIIMVGESCRIPRIAEVVENFFNNKPNYGVNLMEAVAIGAAIQGAVLAGDCKNVLLLDVIPMSLGVETQGGIMTVILKKNATIPAKSSQIFSTTVNNQDAVQVHVLQGERELAKDNKSLGILNLTGIPPAPRGAPQIEVVFNIDANGVLHVSAKDKGTGREQAIHIEAGTGLGKVEIEKMKAEAKINEAIYRTGKGINLTA